MSTELEGEQTLLYQLHTSDDPAAQREADRHCVMHGSKIKHHQ